MAETDSKAPAKAKPAALRKGALVRVNRAAYNASLEAAASDPTAPDYIFEGPGEQKRSKTRPCYAGKNDNLAYIF